MKNALLGAAAIAVIATTANAQQLPDPIPNPDNADQAATIFRVDGVCSVNIAGIALVGDVFQVNTNSRTDRQVLVCKGEIDDPGTSKAVIERNFQCFSPFGVTTDSRQVLSPSGKWTSTCFFDNKD